MQAQFERNIAGTNMVLGAKGSPLQLVLCGLYHIDVPTGNIPLQAAAPFLNPRHPLIKEAVPLSIGDSYRLHRIVGTTPAFLTYYQASVAEGRVFASSLEVVAGASAARRLGLKIGSNFLSEHGLNADSIHLHEGHQFKVVGILMPTNSVADQLLLTPLESIWDMHAEHRHDEDDAHDDHQHEADTDSREITNVLVRFKNHNFQTLQMPRNINENTDLQAASPAYEVNKLAYQTGLGFDALRVLAYIIVGVSALSVLFSLLAALKDRRQELALMRVMGSSRERLFSLIALEGIWIAALGTLLGLLLGHLGIAAVSGYMEEQYRYHLNALSWLSAETLLIVGALVIGLLAAAFPAWRSYSMDISKTLAE